MVHFGYESVSKIRRLENQLKAQQEAIKRHQQVIDEQRVCLNLPKMYEELPHRYRHRCWSPFLCNNTIVERAKLSLVESISAV